MRKSLAPLLCVATLGLGACATNPYGGMGGPLEAVLGSVLGGSQGGYGGSQGGYGSGNFQQAAVNACGNEASRYGQVSVSDVRQQSSSTLRVYGTVGSNYGNRNFQCSYRSDGRITDFDI
ncbi:MAG: hypothetical protein H0W74_06195 [Sphingosinicella sp.]|nr:hypothetical protein [Sphingosinicella sp.]